ncbi:ABC transporter ATP-binding protein [Rhizobium sp. PEPV16]|uniref:ABC transporter ATP-binding protein n=1 Tax=Rhizobium sp. PEPV16 TaxID=1820614 RepID=UPI00124D7E3C|nr:ABC transporter ATP-binding protein [Rhizobium sp. PEPV16]KAF5881383.1 ABC transporter ATP-binding protein [Rhizobium sp. PEPV16]
MSHAALSLSVRQVEPIPLDVQVEVGPGELLALVGPSGSGKTTLLRTIAGLYSPMGSVVRCNGETWADQEVGVFLPPHRRAVGLVFQNYALFPHMSALSNIVAAIGHRPRAEREERARHLMRLVHLDGLEKRMPHQLSGGQQQRVAVARALARDPKVLLLDEPFSAVDKATRQRLYHELADLRRNLAIPIVLVTHDFDEAARLADRMALLDHGRILQTGKPSDVLARPVSGRAARLVDLRNMFGGVVARQADDSTMLDWQGRHLIAPFHSGFEEGERVLWGLPSTQVVLLRPEATKPAVGNFFSGRIVELVTLSESTVVAVVLDGRDEPRLSLTIPAQYARRNALATGSDIEVALLPEAIHIMKADDDEA